MPEKQTEQEKPVEENESETLPEREKLGASLTAEEELKDDVNMATDKTMYCTICNKQIEKYGRRKEDLKKPGWVFCPKHGWIQEGLHEGETVLEKPIRLSIEEVSEKQTEQEKPVEGNESETLPEREKPEAALISEEEQLRADLSGETELRMADLSTKRLNVIRNKFTVIGVIISAIFVTILLGFLLDYFSSKSPTNKSPEMTSLKESVQKGESVQSQAPVQTKEAVSLSETAEAKKETKEKSLQTQKPSKAIFTVQVGAFSDASYAKSLKTRLNKKGYDAYITTSKSKKKGKVYKVWIGKFSDRKKAEILSAKIKKTEGLQTFVTSLPPSLKKFTF